MKRRLPRNDSPLWTPVVLLVWFGLPIAGLLAFGIVGFFAGMIPYFFILGWVMVGIFRETVGDIRSSRANRR